MNLLHHRRSIRRPPKVDVTPPPQPESPRKRALLFWGRRATGLSSFFCGAPGLEGSPLTEPLISPQDLCPSNSLSRSSTSDIPVLLDQGVLGGGPGGPSGRRAALRQVAQAQVAVGLDIRELAQLVRHPLRPLLHVAVACGQLGDGGGRLGLGRRRRGLRGLPCTPTSALALSTSAEAVAAASSATAFAALAAAVCALRRAVRPCPAISVMRSVADSLDSPFPSPVRSLSRTRGLAPRPRGWARRGRSGP